MRKANYIEYALKKQGKLLPCFSCYNLHVPSKARNSAADLDTDKTACANQKNKERSECALSAAERSGGKNHTSAIGINFENAKKDEEKRIREKKCKRAGKQRSDCVRVFAFDKIDSTNNAAKRLIKSGVDLGECFIFALEQTAGRGRYDRSFVSGRKKGLYLTYILPVKDEKLNIIAPAGCFCALAVINTVEKLLPDHTENGKLKLSIKWPNDVKLNGKKLCGILPESVVYEGRRYLILGAGINLNYRENDFCEELRDKAVSVYMESGVSINLYKAERIFVEEILSVMSYIKTGNKAEYESLCRAFENKCDAVGKIITFGTNAERTGKVLGLSADCGLLIEENGETITLNWGETWENII